MPRPNSSYVTLVTDAVHLNDKSIGAPPSKYVRDFGEDMLLFEDADGDYFAAAWRNGLVIDEAPLEAH